jgi:hypothetical protein
LRLLRAYLNCSVIIWFFHPKTAAINLSDFFSYSLKDLLPIEEWAPLTINPYDFGSWHARGSFPYICFQLLNKAL